MQATASLVSFPVDFAISRSRILYSHHVVVTIADGQHSGVGSGVLYRGTPWLAYRLWHAGLRARVAADPTDSLEDVVRVEPGLAFAVDAARWDLRGRASGKPVAELLGGVRHAAVPVTEQIFLSNWRRSEPELRAILARGTTHLKVKVGLGPQRDLTLLRRVREVVGAGVEVRIDANRAYGFDDATALCRQAAGLGVLAVEEPLQGSWDDLRRFREAVGLPVMLDESVLSLDDLRAAIRAQALDSLNIKLTRVGGLSRAVEYRKMCGDAGIAVSLGCNEDLGPGMAAIVHLAAATPDLYSMEGLGHLRLGVDLGDVPLRIQDGAVAVPAGAGLGVTLGAEWQKRLAGRARVFDLDGVSAASLRGFSLIARGRQRATNLVYRARRRLAGGRG